MTSFFKRIFCLFLFIFILRASFLFAKEASSYYIPQNSIFVFSVNLKSLYEKSDLKNNVFLTDLKKRLLNKTQKKESMIYSDLIDDPGLIGVEKNAFMHIFYIPNYLTKSNKKLIGITGTLNNKDTYQKILMQYDFIKKTRDLYSYKNFKYVFQSGFFTAWDDNQFFIIYDLQFSEGDKFLLKEYEAMLDNIQRNISMDKTASFNSLMQEEWDLCAWFDLGSLIMNEADNSYDYKALSKKSFLLSQEYMEQAKKYKKIHAEKGDRQLDIQLDAEMVKFFGVSDYIEMGQYGKASEIYESMAENETKNAKRYIELDKKYSRQNKRAFGKLDGLSMSMKLNFINGKVIIDEDLYAGKNLSFPKSSSNIVNPDIVKYFPQEYILFAGLSFNVKEYYNFIKEISFGDMIESLDEFETSVEEVNVTMDEVLNMFNGNFYFSFSEYNSKNDDYKIAFSAEIKDKEGIDKFIKMLKDKEEISVDIIKPGLESYYFNDEKDKEKIYLVVKDNIFYVVTSDIRNNILTNKTTFTTNEKIKINKKNTLVGFLNYSNLLRAIYTDKKTKDEAVDFLFYMNNKIKNIEINASTVNDKKINYKLIIELSNTEENSLKVLLDWILFYVNEAKVI